MYVCVCVCVCICIRYDSTSTKYWIDNLRYI